MFYLFGRGGSQKTPFKFSQGYETTALIGHTRRKNNQLEMEPSQFWRFSTADPKTIYKCNIFLHKKSGLYKNTLFSKDHVLKKKNDKKKQKKS